MPTSTFSALLLLSALATACVSPADSQVPAQAGHSEPAELPGPGHEMDGSRSAQNATVERRLATMGTHLAIEVTAATRSQALAASEAAVRAIEACARRLSTWTSDSELAALNLADVGEPLLVSTELARELARCLELWRETGGAFDPAVGRLVEVWDLRGGGRRPSAAEIERALVPGGLGAALEIDGPSPAAAGRLVTKHLDVTLEEGAFGKGAALDLALATLANMEAERVEIDLGGQVACWSRATETFAVALADPRDRSRAVVEVELTGGSLATTGNSERGVNVEGRRFAHVLDPESGLPAADFGSLTVWSPSAFDADALSTALYILGPEAALAWAEAHADVEVLCLETVPRGLACRFSSGLAGRVHARIADLALLPVPLPRD